MAYQKLILLAIISFTVTGCSMKMYYFPMSELTSGNVYKYKNLSDPNNTQYWKLTYDTEDHVLTTEAYLSDFSLYEIFKEKSTANGTEVILFTSYFKNQNDVLFPVPNMLKEVDVFKWKTKEPYTYSSENDYDENTKMLFSKERAYIAKQEISVFRNTHEAIKFKEFYKTTVLNSTEKFEYTQFSYYVKGIGLAKMEKEFTDGHKETLVLTEIMTIEKWNSLQ